VRQSDLFALWSRAKPLGLATPNIGLLTDIVCCPGGDFCSLANAKSIPIADAITRRFDDFDYRRRPRGLRRFQRRLSGDRHARTVVPPPSTARVDRRCRVPMRVTG
jgi:sulfite reductase beta subunit-like hemoprotein